MNGRSMSRRLFLRLLGSSSFSLAVPVVGATGHLLSGCTPPICGEDPGFPGDGSCGPVPISLVSDPDPAVMIERAVELVGGLDFLSPGETVLIKPVVNSANPFPATTSPFLLGKVIELLEARGAGRVILGERAPVWRDTLGNLRETGLYQAARDGGLGEEDIVVFEDDDFVPVNPPLAVNWGGGFSRPAVFDEVDHIVLLPTIRTHAITEITMGMKSLVGAIPPSDRDRMHLSLNILPKIAELQTCTEKIRLSILDARQGFSDGGPDEGTLITPGMVIAGTNVTAVDAVGLALLRHLGTTPMLMLTKVWSFLMIARGVAVDADLRSASGMDFLAEGIDCIDSITCQLV